MKYRAIWEVKGIEYTIFPRSKNTSFFQTIDAAEAALERLTRHCPDAENAALRRLAHYHPDKDNTRGIIRDTNGKIVMTIAL